MPDQPHLDALLSQVIRQARAAGIPVSSRIAPQVRVNGRAKTRLGCCRTSSRGHVIEISAALCGGTDSAIRQVLAHEVLHTCPGCSNHGAQWKLWAERMNQAYGYRIQRTDSPQALGIQDNRPVRYLILCSRCGADGDPGYRRLPASPDFLPVHPHSCALFPLGFRHFFAGVQLTARGEQLYH